jgi:hypothetical protein
VAGGHRYAVGVHPLLSALEQAAGGSFPPPDGAVTFCRALDDGLEAVVAFTGHAFIATRLTPADLLDLVPDGFGRASHPEVLKRMAGAGGEIGTLDATLVAYGRGGSALEPRTDLDDHPRVRHARSIRHQVAFFGDTRGLVTVGRGLAGRIDIGVEAFEPGRSSGLVADALTLVPEGKPVFAAVSPGNARSLRAFLRAGFIPVASEVVIRSGS